MFYCSTASLALPEIPYSRRYTINSITNDMLNVFSDVHFIDFDLTTVTQEVLEIGAHLERDVQFAFEGMFRWLYYKCKR